MRVTNNRGAPGPLDEIGPRGVPRRGLLRWFGKLFESPKQAQPITGHAVREIHSKVRGVTHRNADGADRQWIIARRARVGQRLRLLREADNPVDSLAIALLLPTGEQIGYASAALAEEVRGWIADGSQVRVSISELTGGTRGKPFRGVNILINVN